MLENFGNEPAEFYCEVCGQLMGFMSYEAWAMAHRHCDSNECCDTCAGCRREYEDLLK